jgi:hypothetical protein
MEGPTSAQRRGTSSLEHGQDREHTSAGLHDVTRLLKVTEYEVGFYLGVGIGILRVVPGVPHSWHGTKEGAHGSGELGSGGLFHRDMTAGAGRPQTLGLQKCAQRLANAVPQIRVGGVPAPSARGIAGRVDRLCGLSKERVGKVH